MPIESRSRVISIRLTVDEYTCFRELCFAHGIRTLSEMARAAMQKMLLQSSSPSPQGSMETRLAQLEGRLHLLSLEVKRLGNP
jgi:hypothetical protein